MSNITNITCNSFLGKGNYGCVFKINVTNNNKSKNFALKVNFNDNYTDFIPNICEIDILRKFRMHPFLISVQDIYHTNVLFNICSFANFSSYISKKNCADFHFTFPVSESVLDVYVDDFHGHKPYASKLPISSKRYLFDMVNVLHHTLIGLEFLHNNKVIHGDVKLDNVLLYISGDRMQGVLTDLGLSSYECKKFPSSNFSIMPHIYRPPEVLLREHIDEKIDIWGFANIAYECFVGEIFTTENFNNFNKPIIADNSSKSNAYFLSKIIYNSPNRVNFEQINNFNNILMTRSDFKTENQIEQYFIKNKTEKLEDFSKYLNAVLRTEDLISPYYASLFRPTFKERFKKNPEGLQFAFEQTGFTYDILDDFMKSAFTFNHNLRPSATTLLKHKLFEHESYKTIYKRYLAIYVNGIKNVINDPRKIMVNILKTPERQIMLSYHRHLLEKNINNCHDITFRVILHSMQHCDAFLYDVYKKDNIIPFTDEELFKYMISFVFMSIKVFNVNKIIMFEDFFELSSEKMKIFKEFSAKFESIYLEKNNYCFYKPTILETLDCFIDDSRRLDQDLMIKIFNCYASDVIEKISNITIYSFTENFIKTIDMSLDEANKCYSNPEFYKF